MFWGYFGLFSLMNDSFYFILLGVHVFFFAILWIINIFYAYFGLELLILFNYFYWFIIFSFYLLDCVVLSGFIYSNITTISCSLLINDQK